MNLTLDHHLKVQKLLEDEAAKARAAARKAAKACETVPYGEEFIVENKAAAASRHAQQYFVDYIRDQVIP